MIYQSHHTHHYRSRAFTLIELLVVISIVALISAAILATLSNARDKGKIAAVTHFADNNYHKLGINTLLSMDFSEGSGTTVPLDATGNFTTAATVSHSSDTPLGVGYSLNSNGIATIDMTPTSGSTVTVPDTTGITISIWVKGSSPAGGNLISINTGGPPMVLYLNTANPTGSTCVFSGPNSPITYNSIIIGDNKWHNITCTYDTASKNVSVYVDGGLVNSGTNTVPQTVSSITKISITSSTFTGLIDKLQIWSGSLTASAVQNIYAEGLKDHQLAQE